MVITVSDDGIGPEKSKVASPSDISVTERSVTAFKSMSIALKELQPFILEPQHLSTFRSTRFDHSPVREILGNWLICAVGNSYRQKDDLIPTTDPLGADGRILDRSSGETIQMEHVVAHPRGAQGDPESRILAAIRHKFIRGVDYATGKTLVVFLLDGEGGYWLPESIYRLMPENLAFDAVWVFSLYDCQDGYYQYGITQLSEQFKTQPVWLVVISPSFTEWTVKEWTVGVPADRNPHLST